MKTEKLVEQLELYSNAVVAFMVAQSVAFAFTFGTNAAFGCEITRYKGLSGALIVYVVVATASASWVLVALAQRMCALSAETPAPLSPLAQATLHFAARAKIAITCLFALFPIGLLIFFGLLPAPDTGRCAKPAKAASAGAAWVQAESAALRRHGMPPAPIS